MNDHELKKAPEMVFACKKCKKVFRKDMMAYEGTYFLKQRLISTVPTATTTTSWRPSPRKTDEVIVQQLCIPRNPSQCQETSSHLKRRDAFFLYLYLVLSPSSFPLLPPSLLYI